MKILAIDTSTIACSAAVADENKLYGELFTDFKAKHSEKLLVLCDSLLKNLRMKIDEIDYFAVTSGPGSFTGLRIGMATVKGFAMAASKPIVLISSLEALAYNAVYFGGIICPMLDAQRNQLYSAAYASDTANLTVIKEENVYEFNEMFDILNSYEKNVLLLGDGAVKFLNKFKEKTNNRFMLANYNTIMPKASNAAYLAVNKIKNGETTDHFTAMPNYIRTAQAEENYMKRQNK